MPETIFPTVADLRLRFAGLDAVLNAADENMMKVRICDPNFDRAMSLVLVAIGELDRAKATLDGLEMQLRALELWQE